MGLVVFPRSCCPFVRRGYAKGPTSLRKWYHELDRRTRYVSGGRNGDHRLSETYSALEATEGKDRETVDSLKASLPDLEDKLESVLDQVNIEI